ncbi:type VI secretion system baseplate subunit TssF [Azospira inquinata]|uniref:Type VI secretion system baseplate subunit TssF n=1 Tax=Azospira inquinata TaxID=2785627 RepID=A0A975XV63_9RHOO|nr:type VI secretion system baseplate subunit TssF [Azospira inquinata]QWT45149.1 type VI secretion system baseplate subunit TssF [Azospira inquinata]QWT49518.1 type VI secretion system baseplate subunit TssF [Azospira inquinata]
MLDELLPYYERELGYLRKLSGEFAQRYPKIARRLQLEGEQCEDPHVERLIEAFSFLAARIHRKIDDEYPEIAESFLQVLYPHYLRPFPSCSIVQLDIDPSKPTIADRYPIPRHHPLISPTINGTSCRFRTAYDVEIWPLLVASAKLELSQTSEYLSRLMPAAAVITLELETLGGQDFGALDLSSLRFFLDGEGPLMHLLHETLFSRLKAIRIDDGKDTPAHTVLLTPEALEEVGFGEEECLLDYDQRSFLGYRLLSEYFAFPEKFLFFRLKGLRSPALRHPGNRLRIQFFLSQYGQDERYLRLQQTLSASNFKLGCTPVINLFRHAAEPIRLTHYRESYPVIPDSRKPRAFEVISVDKVNRAERLGNQEVSEQVPPFYAIGQHGGPAAAYYWYTSRDRATGEGDGGTEVHMHLTDLHFTPVRPEAEVLSLDLTCSNRDLPASLPFGGNQGDFQIPGHSVISRVKVLRKPTPSLRITHKRGLQWRLVSHLALNHLSIASQGKAALQELLGLYNLTDSQGISRQIQGIQAIDSRPHTTRVSGPLFSGFVRGTEIDLTLDESFYVGTGTHLFAMVLERFFALYCAPNSFTRLRVFTKQHEGILFQWPPRTGTALVI